MGVLNYAGVNEYFFEDRLLAHLKIVISGKLLRQESFLFSWVNPVENGSGRYSIWLSPTIPIGFFFSSGTPPRLNRTWIEVLAETANSRQGLRPISERDLHTMIYPDNHYPPKAERQDSVRS